MVPYEPEQIAGGVIAGGVLGGATLFVFDVAPKLLSSHLLGTLFTAGAGAMGVVTMGKMVWDTLREREAE